MPALRSSTEWAAERDVNGVLAVDSEGESVEPFLGLAAWKTEKKRDRGYQLLCGQVFATTTSS